jgi:hypothetical protein
MSVRLSFCMYQLRPPQDWCHQIWYCTLLHKSVQEIDAVKLGQKISSTLHEHLRKFRCCRWHKIATEVLSLSNMTLNFYGTRRGINITRTRQNVTLYVHCLSCNTCKSVMHRNEEASTRWRYNTNSSHSRPPWWRTARGGAAADNLTMTLDIMAPLSPQKWQIYQHVITPLTLKHAINVQDLVKVPIGCSERHSSYRWYSDRHWSDQNHKSSASCLCHQQHATSQAAVTYVFVFMPSD